MYVCIYTYNIIYIYIYIYIYVHVHTGEKNATCIQALSEFVFISPEPENEQRNESLTG